jgi:predicted nucleic acid-binding protein
LAAGELAPGLIVCDTSALLALVNRRDRDYARVRAAAERSGGPYVVPAATLGADLQLGLVDAAVIACAERRDGLVLNLDRRHFDVVAREGTIRILP